MIISASRRTDIPAFYSEWFMNRLKEGYFYVRNPMNIRQVSKVPLSADIVDCIVFWTKNPEPIMDRLDEIESLGYKYYFQFTLTPYDRTIEKGLNKPHIIETFKKLSDKIGSNKMVWRYDPIILNDKLTVEYHIKAFEELSEKLKRYTEDCIISFVDLYRKIQVFRKANTIREISNTEMIKIAVAFAEIARANGISVKSCSEKIDLSVYGIQRASCIDRGKVESIINCRISTKKDKNQRAECGCIESIDMGAYNTCSHGCIYCYANYNRDYVSKNIKKHDPASPLLVGSLLPEGRVTERKVVSLKEKQLTFFQ